MLVFLRMHFSAVLDLLKAENIHSFSPSFFASIQLWLYLKDTGRKSLNDIIEEL